MEAFSIDERGCCAFESPPDYEDHWPMPTATTCTQLRFEASDGGVSATTATEEVTIEITNVDEPGTVTLSTLQPQVGVAIVATLADPDNVTEWHRHLAVVQGQQPHHGRDRGRRLAH